MVLLKYLFICLMVFNIFAPLTIMAQPEPAGPEWSRGLPIYQISPRYYSEDGSLASVKADLPRIKAMGVGIIYMMPIHPCKDDISNLDAQRRCNYFQSADYMAVNPVLGTMEDWKDFVKTVHDSGMRLILGFVPRHCSWTNPLVTERPEWFSGESWGLPAFDFSRQDVRDYHLSVMEHWVKESGVDGFRIDVAGTIPLEVFKGYRPEIDTWGEIFMLAEAQGPEHHPQYDMTYDWRLMQLIIEGISTGNRPASDIDDLIHDDTTSYPEGALRMRHTDNHDFNIGMGAWGGVEPNMELRYRGGQKAFTALCATLPGKFMFFNGNEINNPDRIPHGWDGDINWMNWRENPEFTGFYTKLCKVRRENPAIYMGEMIKLESGRDDRIYAFVRRKDENRVIVVLNLSDQEQEFSISSDLVTGPYTELFTEEEVEFSGNAQFSLAAWDYRIYVTGTPVITGKPDRTRNPIQISSEENGITVFTSGKKGFLTITDVRGRIICSGFVQGSETGIKTELPTRGIYFIRLKTETSVYPLRWFLTY
jgi:glycosidase